MEQYFIAAREAISPSLTRSLRRKTLSSSSRSGCRIIVWTCSGCGLFLVVDERYIVEYLYRLYGLNLCTCGLFLDVDERY